MIISVLSMLLFASDAPKPSKECIAAAHRFIDIWEAEAKGTSQEASIADLYREPDSRERAAEEAAPKLFENQDVCNWTNTVGAEYVRVVVISTIPDHPEYGVTRKKTPDDPALISALRMQPPPDDALRELANHRYFTELVKANLILSNCDLPGLTVADRVLIGGTEKAVRMKLLLTDQQYERNFLHPAMLELRPEDSCRKNAKATRDTTRKIKELGAKIIK
ncbi:hypothetical protein [Agrobacterium tumefaciens]|uniref:hypothetical protein n=1 Tax=Agrobacterium tumefaciens TaxID=358 RepID=UPI001573C9EB|nr:hypothetical protein [Agrobacterium tumefaciens]NTE33398.1 hypothetical protein [Agrobacterium tumefaciens]NTE48908.1 hypothetical protein [Agrobacterium tumefaciens]